MSLGIGRKIVSWKYTLYLGLLITLCHHCFPQASLVDFLSLFNKLTTGFKSLLKQQKLLVILTTKVSAVSRHPISKGLAIYPGRQRRPVTPRCSDVQSRQAGCPVGPNWLYVCVLGWTPIVGVIPCLSLSSRAVPRVDWRGQETGD